MIEIVFRGRLGNQMFQYAYALTLAERLGCRLKTDVTWYYHAPETFDLWRFEQTGLTPITLSSEIFGRVVERLQMLRKRRECDMYVSYFEPKAMEVKQGYRLNGWFQSLRYFEQQADRIRKLYNLSRFTPQADLEDLRRRAGGRPLVAVHVRRGDYVGNKNFFLGDYDAYYTRAFAHQAAALGAPPYLVVISDDPAWCRQWPLLKGLDHHIYESPDPAFALHDMAIMAACDHNIITNSSFSWWGAWLGLPAGRVVTMPSRWLPGRTTDECDMDVPGWVQL